MATWYDKQVQEARLSSEKATLKALQEVYTQAAKDCAEKINQLELRADLGENVQSAVYQAQYQRAVLGQLETALESLQDGAYDTISDYLQECYTDNYVGTMYSLQQQGIPIITPIDQNQVVKAVELDSLLSKGLYSAMGENVETLKTAVAAEVSRGVASGKSWSQVAKSLTGSFKTTEFGKAYRLAVRITRTEGHRVQNQAQLDAMTTAKDKGADVVKQWDATLDDRTRPEHQALDGQIKEIEDYFEVDGYRGKMPGGFRAPEMDINCRCCMLQRAAWALDEDELETLKERAEFFGLDKTGSFAEFREKYLTAAAKTNSLIRGVTGSKNCWIS